MQNKFPAHTDRQETGAVAQLQHHISNILAFAKHIISIQQAWW
jgi:hypothetical protein